MWQTWQLNLRSHPRIKNKSVLKNPRRSRKSHPKRKRRFGKNMSSLIMRM
jgi:hypothetical protein